MRTKFKQVVITTLLAMMFVGGCARQPGVHSAKSPEELKQLTEVTDSIVILARSLEDGAEPSGRRDAIRQAVQAVVAAEPQYQRHSDVIADRTNHEALGCIDAHTVTLMELEAVIARLDAVTQGQDDASATDAKALLQELAMDTSQCAALNARLLVESQERAEALEHGSVLISKIYAIAATTRVASGLSLGPLLESQIRTYEVIAAKLGRRHDAPVVTDALPKLRATVAMLDKREADRVMTMPPPPQ